MGCNDSKFDEFEQPAYIKSRKQVKSIVKIDGEKYIIKLTKVVDFFKPEGNGYTIEKTLNFPKIDFQNIKDNSELKFAFYDGINSNYAHIVIYPYFYGFEQGKCIHKMKKIDLDDNEPLQLNTTYLITYTKKPK